MTRRVLPVGLLGGAGLLLGGCTSRASMLEPRGPRADQIADIWWVMFGLSLVIYVGVLGLLFYAIFRPRRGEAGGINTTALIVGGGIAVPLVVLPIVWFVTLRGMMVLATPTRPPELTVDVVGHQWWYEVSYPEHRVTVRDELYLPAGVPVRVRVTSADVIHSFWVPQLAGKLDMIPGSVNELWIEASRPGVYFGECGEFCGLLHAKMHFRVVAQPPAEFAAWLAEQQQAALDRHPGVDPGGERGALADPTSRAPGR